jgi:hypothetical protein
MAYNAVTARKNKLKKLREEKKHAKVKGNVRGKRRYTRKKPLTKREQAKSLLSDTIEFANGGSPFNLYEIQHNIPIFGKSNSAETESVRKKLDEIIPGAKVGDSFVVQKIHYHVVRRHLKAQYSPRLFRGNIIPDNKKYIRIWRMK